MTSLPASLAAVAPFRSLGAEAVERMASIAETRTVAAGTYLAHEDEQGDELFLVLSGRACAEIRVTGRADAEVLGAFEAGDFIGETVLFGLYRRVASVRAVADLEVAVWHGADLEVLFDDDRRLGYAVVRHLATGLCHRLQMADLAIERLLIEKSMLG